MLENSKLHTNLTVGTALTAFYTNLSPQRTFIRGFIAFNNSTTEAASLYIHVVFNSGGNLGEPDISNKMFHLDFEPKETVTFTAPYPILLNANNDSIFTRADNNTVNLLLLGDKLV